MVGALSGTQMPFVLPLVACRHRGFSLGNAGSKVPSPSQRWRMGSAGDRCGATTAQGEELPRGLAGETQRTPALPGPPPPKGGNFPPKWWGIPRRGCELSLQHRAEPRGEFQPGSHGALSQGGPMTSPRQRFRPVPPISPRPPPLPRRSVPVGHFQPPRGLLGAAFLGRFRLQPAPNPAPGHRRSPPAGTELGHKSLGDSPGSRGSSPTRDAPEKGVGWGGGRFGKAGGQAWGSEMAWEPPRGLSPWGRSPEVRAVPPRSSPAPHHGERGHGGGAMRRQTRSEALLKEFIDGERATVRGSRGSGGAIQG